MAELQPGSPPLRWPTEQLWQAVVPWLPDFSVEILPEIDSSNTELMRRARAGRTVPVLLVAEHQTAGRGRMGRQWHSPPGSSLTFSLGLPLAPADWSGLSLAVGVSLADSLAQLAGADVRIKWPNDLWLGAGKLAGILIETAGAGPSRFAVIGVGINLREPAEQWQPPAGAQGALPAPMPAVAPAWLARTAPVNAQVNALVNAPIDAPQVLGAVAGSLVHDVLRFEREGWAAFAPRFALRDVLLGRSVQLSDGRSGLACGLSATAALRVQTPHGIEEVHSGEVSVRPQDWV
jgi:BirA family biotin operon repressor/biotin-[acetyl-CoA-carboxylase] ligase